MFNRFFQRYKDIWNVSVEPTSFEMQFELYPKKSFSGTEVGFDLRFTIYFLEILWQIVVLKLLLNGLENGDYQKCLSFSIKALVKY